MKYKLLGLFAISDDELDELELYTEEINGHYVIMASMKGNKFIGGVKVTKPMSIPNAWHSYLGHYKVLNNHEPEDWKIVDTEFVIEEGYLLFKIKLKSDLTATKILQPINDTEATIEGLGRGMQETIYLKDGLFHHQGIQFKKIEKGKE